MKFYSLLFLTIWVVTLVSKENKSTNVIYNDYKHACHLLHSVRIGETSTALMWLNLS